MAPIFHRLHTIPIVSLLVCFLNVGLLATSACDSQNPSTISTDTASWSDSANTTVSTSIGVGTHLAGKNSVDDFLSLQNGDKVKIVWGFQGFNMAVFAVRIADPTVEDVTVSIAFFDQGVSLASLYYTNLHKNFVAENQAWFFDLYMIIPDVSVLVPITGTLHTTAWTKDHVKLAESQLTLGFDPPPTLFPTSPTSPTSPTPQQDAHP